MTTTEIQLPKVAQTRISRLANASGRSPAAMLRFVLRDGFDAVELSIKENARADEQFAAGATVTERALAARRGAVRTFRRFETLVGYLKNVGITQYHVDAANFDAAALTTTRVRPDSAERMRSAFEASKHAEWMQQKAEQSLADTRPNVTHEQAMASAQAVIDAKRKKHARQAAA